VDDQIGESEMTKPTAEELVGRRLHALRVNQGLSLKALADISKLNINTLSLIENGKISPSVSTLQQLSTALKTPITSFFEVSPVSKQIVFTRCTDRSQNQADNIQMASLGKNFVNNAVQPFEITLDAGSNIGDCPVVHTGNEFVYCLKGCVLYRVNGEDFTLETGDSLLFQAHLPHCWKNPGNEPAKLLLVIIPTDTREELGGRHFSSISNERIKEINMKIAVVSDDGQNLSQHFGRAPYYIVFSIQEGKITGKEIREKMGHNQFAAEHNHEHDHGQHHGLDDASHGKHATMAQAIADCEVLICGGMGMGAYESMRRLNIQPFVTASTDPETAVKTYLEGKLVDHIEKLH